MHRTLILASFAAAAFAQNSADLFNRAPAGVDNALRARVTEFFRLHVTGEYRKAEELVAEDTKDFFYATNKPHYLSFEIGKIEYSDGYTKAKVLVTVKMAVMLPGFNGKVMEIPSPSYWKLVDDKWYWYLDKAMMNASPFGEMKPGPPSLESKAATMPMIPGSLDEVYAQVKVDKRSVSLKPGSTDEVVITNNMVGPINLSVQGKLEGIAASFDNPEIKPGEKATMTVRAADSAKGGVLNVYVQQTRQTIPIEVVLK